MELHRGLRPFMGNFGAGCLGLFLGMFVGFALLFAVLILKIADRWALVVSGVPAVVTWVAVYLLGAVRSGTIVTRSHGRAGTTIGITLRLALGRERHKIWEGIVRAELYRFIGDDRLGTECALVGVRRDSSRVEVLHNAHRWMIDLELTEDDFVALASEINGRETLATDLESSPVYLGLVPAETSRWKPGPAPVLAEEAGST